MCAVRIKNVFPSSGAAHNIPAIRLYEDVDLPGPLYIVEGCAYGSPFCLSGSGMCGSATPRALSWGGTLLIWLFTHLVCPLHCGTVPDPVGVTQLPCPGDQSSRRGFNGRVKVPRVSLKTLTLTLSQGERGKNARNGSIPQLDEAISTLHDSVVVRSQDEGFTYVFAAPIE